MQQLILNCSCKSCLCGSWLPCIHSPYAAPEGRVLFLGWLREVSLATLLATAIVTTLILAGRSEHVWAYYICALPVVYALVVQLTLHLLRQTVGDLRGLAPLLRSKRFRKVVITAAAAAGLAEGISSVVLGPRFAWFPRAAATSTAAAALWGVLPVVLVAWQVGGQVNRETHHPTTATATSRAPHGATQAAGSCSDWLSSLTQHIVSDARAVSARCSCCRRCTPWLHAALTVHDAAPMHVDSPVAVAVSSPHASSQIAPPPQQRPRRDSGDGRQLCNCRSDTAAFMMQELPKFARSLGASALGLKDYSHSTLACFACCVVGVLLPWADVLVPTTAESNSHSQADEVSWWIWALVVLGPVVIASALTDASGVLFEIEGGASNEETGSSVSANGTAGTQNVSQGKQTRHGAAAPPIAPRVAAAAAARRHGGVALRRIGLALVLAVTLLHTPAFTALQLQEQFQHVEQWLLVGRSRAVLPASGIGQRAHRSPGRANGTELGAEHEHGPQNPWSGSALSSQDQLGGGSAMHMPWGNAHLVELQVDLALEQADHMLPGSASAILLTGHNILASFWHVLVTLLWLAALQAFTLLWQQVLWAAQGRRHVRGDLMWPAQLWFYLQYYTLYCVNDNRPFMAFIAVLVLINVDYYFAAVGGYVVVVELTSAAMGDAAATVLQQQRQLEKYTHMLPILQRTLEQMSSKRNTAGIAAAAEVSPNQSAQDGVPRHGQESRGAQQNATATSSVDQSPAQRTTQRPRRTPLSPRDSGEASAPILSRGGGELQSAGVLKAVGDSGSAAAAVLRPGCTALQSSCWRVSFTHSIAAKCVAHLPCMSSSQRGLEGEVTSAGSDSRMGALQDHLLLETSETQSKTQYRHEKTYWDAAADISTLAVMGVAVSLLELTGDLNGRLGAAFGFSQTPLLQMWWQLLAMLFARLVTTFCAAQVQAFQAAACQDAEQHSRQTETPNHQTGKAANAAQSLQRGSWEHAFSQSIVHCGFLLLVTLACFQQPGLPMRLAFQDGG